MHGWGCRRAGKRGIAGTRMAKALLANTEGTIKTTTNCRVLRGPWQSLPVSVSCDQAPKNGLSGVHGLMETERQRSRISLGAL